jgi:hypothetical protein
MHRLSKSIFSILTLCLISLSAFGQVGTWPVDTRYVYFGATELGQSAVGNYGLLQDKVTGSTFLNSPVDIFFRIGNSQKMYLANSGNLGIGTTAPNQRLDVVGRLKFRSDGYESSGLWLTGNDGAQGAFIGQMGTSSTDAVGIYHGNAWRFWVDQSGNVGTAGKLTLGSSTGTMTSSTGLRLGVDQNSIEFLHSPSGPGYGAKFYGADEGNGLTSLRLAVRGASATWTDAMYVRAADNGAGGGNLGYVGFGTNTPTARVEVASGAGGTLIFGGIIGSKQNGHELNLVGGIPKEASWVEQTGGHIRLGGSTRGDVNKNAIQFIQNGVERMRVNDGGKVGIGVVVPGARLDVHESTVLDNVAGNYQLLTTQSGKAYNYFANNIWLYRNSPSSDGNWTTASLHDGISIDNSFGTPGVNTRTWWQRLPAADTQTWGNENKTYMSLMGGYAPYGTVTTLAIKGIVHSQEVKVDLNVPGPDYVFEKSYSLPTLEEVKSYIDQNKHLPEVPSAKEMVANGVNLGEMNMLLLKKIEELTLYTIEMNKKITELTERDEMQQKQIEKLKNIK